MSPKKVASQLLFMVIIFGFAIVDVCMCTYVVLSRRVMPRSADLQSSDNSSIMATRPQRVPCDIPLRMNDRWELVGRPRDKMRIKGNFVYVKYGVTKLKYRCLENRGYSFLLVTSDYSRDRHGVLCLGFATLDQPPAEYSVIRLNGHGPERQLLSPQILPPDMQDYPTLNETCVLRDSNRDEYALIKRQGSWIGAWVRSEKRCSFPEELQRSWNYTYHKAKQVSFSKKTFALELFEKANVETYRFDCSVNDGDLYVLRHSGFVDPETDGVICMNITRLVEDPFYTYELSRLNSGKELHGQVMRFPAGKAVSLYEDCDWVESPARPEYLY